MSTRKKTPPPAGPTCPGCQSQAAELARLQRQQRQQAGELRKLRALLQLQAADLAEERERSRRLNQALEQHRFLDPWFLQQFTQRLLLWRNDLTNGLFHLN